MFDRILRFGKILTFSHTRNHYSMTGDESNFSVLLLVHFQKVHILEGRLSGCAGEAGGANGFIAWVQVRGVGAIMQQGYKKL